MGDFCMPSLGADMEAGTLVEWHVAPGAHVKRGDIVVLVETQKGIVEVEIWETGVIERLLVTPGTKVPVGTVLATVRADEARAPAPAPAPMPTPTAASARAAPPPPEANVDIAKIASNGHGHVRASPAARQLARERGVDIASLHGTGPHGAVTRGDVEHAAAPAPAAEAPSPAQAPSRAEAPSPSPPAARASGNDAMRRAIAAAMMRSKREIPHYYLSSEIDVHRALAWLDAENVRRPIDHRLVLAPLLLKATALALRDVPELNGFYVDDTFRASQSIHVGVAVSLRPGGLVAPAIHDVDQLPVSEVMIALRDLVSRVRAGKLKSSEMTDPTITVTSLGDHGADAVFGVIYPPQVALVGFGTPRERPWAENGLLGVRPVVVASLAADHRVSDGHRGARFLATVARRLSEPEKL